MSSADPLLPGEKRKLSGLRASLLRWATTSGRSFQWRAADASTYQQVVVEVLLQRTTATAVSRFYDEFMARFPGWDELASAEPSNLEAFLKPLGLWRRRAASLLGLARHVVAAGGTLPADPAEHRSIPAVGQYVSNAVRMFEHGENMPLLDVNMARVIERFVRPRRLADIRYDPWLQAAAHWLVRGETPLLVNWAILDFAALVCKARSPLCPSCPVQRRCSYARLGGVAKVQ